MNEKMSNAPVYYALAQAQFNPVAAMAKYVDEIQDRLRREGYPLFEPQQLTQLQLVAPGQGAEPQVAHTTTWLITRADRTAGFILSASAITFHTTHYETHDEFIPQLLLGLEAVHSVVKLDHASRLGLRYLNAIQPKPTETVDQYLVDGLHGVRFEAKQRYALNETVFETTPGPLAPNGTLVARVHRMTSPLGYPPDMVPNGLVPMPKFAVTEVRPHGIIDIDHFVEGRLPLNFTNLADQCLSLHAMIKQVFGAMVTDHARSNWA